MTLLAEMTEVQEHGEEELKRFNKDRPMIVDGSLSEIVTQALNLAYSKTDPVTGDPHHGEKNPDEPVQPGAGITKNIFNPDSPMKSIVHPTLEVHEQIDSLLKNKQFSEFVKANDEEGRKALTGVPLVVFTIPEDGFITEEVNSRIDEFESVSTVNPEDFVFVNVSTKDIPDLNSYRHVNAVARIKAMKKKGALVFSSVEKFFKAVPALNKRKQS